MSPTNPEPDECAEEPVPRVLIVEDKRSLVEMYTEWLDDTYEVTAVTSGDAALEALADSCDIVVLNRRLQQWSGDELVTELRKQGLSQPVVMVTGVEPTPEIIDLPIDEYLVKPISKADLCSTIDLVLRLTSYDELLQEYFSGISKLYSLQASKSPFDSRDDEKIKELKEQITALEVELDLTRGEFDEDHYQIAFERVLQ